MKFPLLEYQRWKLFRIKMYGICKIESSLNPANSALIFYYGMDLKCLLFRGFTTLSFIFFNIRYRSTKVTFNDSNNFNKLPTKIHVSYYRKFLYGKWIGFFVRKYVRKFYFSFLFHLISYEVLPIAPLWQDTPLAHEKGKVRDNDEVHASEGEGLTRTIRTAFNGLQLMRHLQTLN